MSRWDITDPDRVHSSEVRLPSEQQRKDADDASSSVGRSGSGSDAAEKKIERPEQSVDTRGKGPSLRRKKHEVQGQTYSLRSTESEAMADMGRFRAIDVRDLARFVYSGHQARMKYDLENLRKQGLVEVKTVFKAHRPARRIVTLTAQGHRFTQKASGLPKGQRIYHGIVKPRELDHDADLYKVYQRAAREIQEKGGKNVRVRLDFELKESINRAKEAAGHLPENMRVRWLAAVAEEHGLQIDGTTIHLPDVQVEYTLSDGRVERENLELLSQNYREQGIRSKAQAGFKIYARAGETNRIRRALRDTGFIREVLSV
jgi:DNA-binding PadR family transcriptional regulator